MNTPQITHWVDGMASIADRYEGFVVDQFGVLHDGQQPYPGAADVLQHLRAQGKRVIVLSNSGKRAATNVQRLAHFGVTPAHYDALITSGELTWQMLRARDRAPFDQLGRRVLTLHPESDATLLEGLTLEPVTDVDNADFVLLASLAPDQPASALQPVLDKAIAHQLPLLCANPDLHRLTPRGVEPSCGTLAAQYESAGGAVTWLGKPHELIYATCTDAFNRWGVHRFIAVGDSLEHDIGGGARAGYATAYIAGGLHAEHYATQGCDTRTTSPWSTAQHERATAVLGTLLRNASGSELPPPTWAMPTLRW